MSAVSFPGSVAEPLQDRSRVSKQSRVVPPTVVAKPRRNEGIDVVRLFAAAGIIFVHSTQSKLFAEWGNFFRFGVPFFLFASLYYQTLSMRRNKDLSLGKYVGGRLGRLYVPFLVWSAIYLVVRDVKRVSLLHLPPAGLGVSALWKGTEYHLWFLPFLLGASIVLAAVQKIVLDKHRGLRWGMIALALIAGCVAIAWGMPRGTGDTFEDPSYVYFQWRLSLPATCWAMAFAWLMAGGTVVYSLSALAGWAGIALTVSCSLRQAIHGIELAPRALTGLGAMAAALSSPWHGKITGALAKFGRRGYGIYLCHVLPVEVLKVMTGRAHLSHTPAVDLIVFALSFGSSLAIVLLLERSKKTAWLNG